MQKESWTVENYTTYSYRDSYTVNIEYFIIIFFCQLKCERESPLLQATPSQPGGKGGMQEGRSFTIFKPYIADRQDDICRVTQKASKNHIWKKKN